MLDQLPTQVWQNSTTMFLDPSMAGGQFLVEIQNRLRAVGHSDQNIAGRIWGCEINKLRVNYAKNTHKLVSDHLMVSDFLNHDWGHMKFDVIVGNPPYQSAESKRIKIWYNFLENSLSHLKDQGHLGLVIPSTWMDQDITVAKDARAVLTGNTMVWLAKDVSQFFSVGERVCALVAQKGGTSGYDGSKIYISDQAAVMDAICTKMKNSSYPPAKTLLRRLYANFHPRENSDFADKIKGKFVNPVVHSSTETWFTKQDVSHMRGHNVIFNNSGYYYQPDQPNRYICYSNTHVAGGNAFQITYASKQEALNALSFFTSKAYRFFVNVSKSGGFNATSLYQMPLLEENQTWTDDLVYAAFGFNKNEIKIIEEYWTKNKA
jgi:hypothetical protein